MGIKLEARCPDLGSGAGHILRAVQDIVARPALGGLPMNHLAEIWARRELARLERKQLRAMARDLRDANKKAEPLRKLAAERRKAGVKGDGFVMRPVI